MHICLLAIIELLYVITIQKLNTGKQSNQYDKQYSRFYQRVDLIDG